MREALFFLNFPRSIVQSERTYNFEKKPIIMITNINFYLKFGAKVSTTLNSNVSTTASRKISDLAISKNIGHSNDLTTAKSQAEALVRANNQPLTTFSEAQAQVLAKANTNNAKIT